MLKKIVGLLLSILSISILLIACTEKDLKTLSLEHENIRFVSIHNKQGFNKILENSNQISIIVNAIENSEKSDEILNPLTPNRTPDEDYSLEVIYFDPTVKHDVMKSYFAWVNKEKQEVKIAPVQKGMTYLYKLSPETVQDIEKLSLFND